MDISKLLTQLQSLATNPKSFWATHKVGGVPVSHTFFSVLGPLAVASAIAQFIKFSLIGISVPLVGVVLVPFFSGLVGLIFSVLMILAGYYVMSIVLNKVAPNFGGSISTDGALEFMALTGGISLVGSIFVIFPYVGWLIYVAAAFYSLYIFWVGVPSQTGVPESKRIPFVAVTVGASIVFALVITSLRSMLLGF